MYTDDSCTGYGGYTVSLGTHIAHDYWGRRDSKHISIYRELKAIYLVNESFTHMRTSKKVNVFTDNQNKARIVISGSNCITIVFRTKYSWNANGFLVWRIKLLILSVSGVANSIIGGGGGTYSYIRVHRP